jgi:hypothetical protein
MSPTQRQKTPQPPPLSELSLLVQTLLSEPKRRRLNSPEARATSATGSRLQREKVSQLFEKWGYGPVKDEAEQLRLALMLLECHDVTVSSQQDSLASHRE